MAEEDKATIKMVTFLLSSKRTLELELEGVKATISAESSTVASSSGASTERAPTGIGYGGG